MLIGLIILLGGALLLIPLEFWIHRQLVGAWDFLAEHALLPALRTLVILAFLFAVYPTPLLPGEVLPDSVPPADPRSLFNWMFLVTLILPLAPQMERFGAFIIPLQTLVGALVLINALEQAAGLSLQPQGVLLLWVLAMAALAHWPINRLAAQLHGRHGVDALTWYDTLSLMLLPPLVLLFTRSFA